MIKMRLEKDKWNQLDKLLGEIGFGGYYDCVEVLRSIIENLCKRKETLNLLTKGEYGKMMEKVRKENDLKVLILLISHLSKF